MENLQLVQPSLDFAEEIRNYRAAFAHEHLHGGNSLSDIENIADWIEHTQKESNAATCRPDCAPSSTYLCIRQSDQKMVGIVNIRHHIEQEFLLNVAGHIGYSIHPAERRKGYATEQLRLALNEAQKLGLTKVLITAADWNIGSQKTILANGGVYEDTRIDPSDGDRMLRYWINLSTN